MSHSTNGCRRILSQLCAVAMLWCLSTSISYSASILVVTGVEGELAENIRLLVAQPPERSNLRQFRRYIDSLPEQAVSALSAYGYYAAEATVKVDQVSESETKTATANTLEKIGDAVKGGTANSDGAEPAPSVTRVTIEVTANEPVRITSLQLNIANSGENKDDFTEVETEVRESLAEGNVFVSSEYESAKTSILNTAQELGYFDFEYASTQVKVSRRANTANIVLLATAGPRYVFGDVLFKQQTFSKTFMERWLTYTQGDPYQASLIGELTDSLQSSGYFSSVRVRPLVDPRYGKEVPVVVDLTQTDKNKVAVGIGYSTDTEFRTKLTWGKPLLNSNGHSAEWGMQLSQDTQSASFEYRIPRSKQPLFNYWGIEYGLKNDTQGDFNSFLSTLNLQRIKRTSTGWTESLFVRWERETFNIGDEEQTTDLVLPGFSYSRSRSKGEPFATWGQSISFQLMGGSKEVLSSINFLKAVGRFRYLREVASRNTLITTLQYGALSSNELDRVPVSQRFFAGGDRTIRGYAYRDISPRDEDDEAIGGRYLEVLNLEYNYRFADLWSAAIFSDIGRAFNRLDEDYKVGAGVGIRWQSPVGAFRVDIATPIDDDERDSIRVHLSLGPDF